MKTLQHTELLSTIWEKEKNNQVLVFCGYGLKWVEENNPMPLEMVVADPFTFYKENGMDFLFSDETEEEIEEFFLDNDQEITITISIDMDEEETKKFFNPNNLFKKYENY